MTGDGDRFASSVSVGQVPGIAKQQEIVLQGAFSLDLEAYLAEQCGLAKNYFQTKLPHGKKK